MPNDRDPRASSPLSLLSAQPRFTAEEMERRPHLGSELSPVLFPTLHCASPWPLPHPHLSLNPAYQDALGPQGAHSPALLCRADPRPSQVLRRRGNCGKEEGTPKRAGPVADCCSGTLGNMSLLRASVSLRQVSWASSLSHALVKTGSDFPNRPSMEPWSGSWSMSPLLGRTVTMSEALPSQVTSQPLPCLPLPATSSGPGFLTRPRASLLAPDPRGLGAALFHLGLLQLVSSHRSCPVLLRRLLFLSVPASDLGVALAGLFPTPGMASAALASLCDMPHP